MPKERKTKKVAPWIKDSTFEWATTNFKNLNASATYIINSAPAIYRQTMIGLKGKFSDSELKLMIDVMNATILSDNWPGATLLGNIPDAIALDGLAEKWELPDNGAGLIKKIGDMHTFQIYVLEIWAHAFWYGGGHKAKTPINDYIKPLL